MRDLWDPIHNLKSATGETLKGSLEKIRAIKISLYLLVPVALMLTLNATACSTNAGGYTSAVGSSEGSKNQAPDFAVTMFQGQDAVGGQKINLHSLFGSKPIVLNFWAGLCPPCRAEMPDLQKFNDEFENRALLIGVDLGQFTGLGNTDDAKSLLSELGAAYPAGFTADADVIENYKVLGMPTTIFIDQNGDIFNKWTGALDSSILKEKVLEMLSQ